MVLQIAAGLFAVYMLARHVPIALRALRGGPDGRRPARAVVPVANVLLAIAILVVAVKGLAGALIRR
ncbi:MAG TPA: hypothetical protein VMU15_09015 [Anaeromyxobacter sp.]|nr:hypothetical protein [Anaeromyxobacter sp.]